MPAALPVLSLTGRATVPRLASTALFGQARERGGAGRAIVEYRLGAFCSLALGLVNFVLKSFCKIWRFKARQGGGARPALSRLLSLLAPRSRAARSTSASMSRWLRSKRGEQPIEIQLNSGRQLPGRSLFIVRVDGVNDRAAAEALVGRELLVQGDDRPELEDGEFHLLDLVGLEARLAETGDVVGTVSDLISGGNDLLELKRPDGTTLLVPFVEAIVPEVHLEQGWLLLTPPSGLLDL